MTSSALAPALEESSRDVATPARTESLCVVAASAYVHGRRVADVTINEAGAWAKQPDHVVWIGLLEPTLDMLRQVQVQFDLHPLAIEDAGKAHQRPKLDQYGTGVFIVARTAQLVGGRIAFGETHLFAGKGYVISVRHGASVSYAPVRQRCEACPTTLSHGEDYILYAILDFIIDNYMPVLETIHAEAEAIEDQVLKRELMPGEIERLYLLRRDLLRLRNAVVPLVEVCRKLEHAEVLAIEPAMQPLFRDVTDHVRRVQEEIDALREVLAFAFETSLMMGQARQMVGQAQQTDITRKLAAWAAILAVPTAVAGISGMNFKYMPELEWQPGYFVVFGNPCDVRGPLLALPADGVAVEWSDRKTGSAVLFSVCSLTSAKIENSSRLVLLGEMMRRGAVQMMGIVVPCSRCDVSVRAMVSQGCAAVYPNGTTWRKQCWRKPARSLHSCPDLIRAIRSAATSSGQSATDCAILSGARRFAFPNGLDVIPEPG